MKGQLKASTPAEYIAQLDEPRKSDVATLHALIRKIAPKFEPYIQMGILAYGHRIVKYAGGRESDWFRIGISSNKNYISLYISLRGPKGNLVEYYKKALPKASIGKGCVRFKRLGDLDSVALAKLIRDGAKAPAKAK